MARSIAHVPPIRMNTPRINVADVDIDGTAGAIAYVTKTVTPNPGPTSGQARSSPQRIASRNVATTEAPRCPAKAVPRIADAALAIASAVIVAARWRYGPPRSLIAPFRPA